MIKTLPTFNFSTVKASTLCNTLQAWGDAPQAFANNDDIEKICLDFTRQFLLFAPRYFIQQTHLNEVDQKVVTGLFLAESSIHDKSHEEGSLNQMIQDSICDPYFNGSYAHPAILPHQALAWYPFAHFYDHSSWTRRAWQFCLHGETVAKLNPAMFKGCKNPDDAAATFRKLAFGYYKQAVLHLNLC